MYPRSGVRLPRPAPHQRPVGVAPGRALVFPGYEIGEGRKAIGSIKTLMKRWEEFTGEKARHLTGERVKK